MTLSRRSLLFAAAAWPLLSLYPGERANAADLPLIRVAKAQAIGIGFMPIDVGESAGIWQQAGVRSRPRRCVVTDRFSKLSRPAMWTWVWARVPD